MRKSFCIVKKILLTQKDALDLFGAHTVNQCPPLGFDKKLAWVSVKDLLQAVATETPNQLVDASIASLLLDHLPLSDFEGGTNFSCRAATLWNRYEESLKVLLSHPALDRVGSSRVEELFSLSHTYVHSPGMKKHSLANFRPALWSVSNLIGILYTSSAETAKSRVKQITYRQTVLAKERDRLTLLSKTRLQA